MKLVNYFRKFDLVSTAIAVNYEKNENKLNFAENPQDNNSLAYYGTLIERLYAFVILSNKPDMFFVEYAINILITRITKDFHKISSLQ